MPSLTVRAAKWAGRKAVGSISSKARRAAANARCTAEPKRRGVKCGRKLRTGRLADGMTCGSEMCQLWFISLDQSTTAHYLGLSEDELAERIAAARAA